MDALPHKLPNNPARLKKLLLHQQQLFQRTTEQQQGIIDRQEKKAERLRVQTVRQKTRIEILEDQLRLLQLHQFGKRSEKFFNPDQCSLFNEAEIIAVEPEPSDDDSITVPEQRGL